MVITLQAVNVIITMAEAIKIHSKFLENNYSEYTYEVVSRLVAGKALSVQDYLGSLRVMNYFQKKLMKYIMKLILLLAYKSCIA